MNRLITLILAGVLFSSCKKSIDYDYTIGVSYQIKCDSCFIMYKTVDQTDSYLKVYDHWNYSFSADKGDSVCLRAQNINGGLLKSEVGYNAQIQGKDTTTLLNGSLIFVDLLD